jgi:phospholipase C
LTWNLTSSYDFTVHGPNGFFRRVNGSTGQPGLEARASQDHDKLRLTLTNNARTPVRATVTDAYHHDRPATYRIAPGRQVEHTTRPDHGWYDLSVTSPGNLRQFAGHLETGQPSTSDPAIG